MNTRTERMNNKAYCAYCGKELRDYSNRFIHSYYGLPIVCNCEKAKRELELYDELKKLYDAPLAESLMDMKVEESRDMLLEYTNPVPFVSIDKSTETLAYLDYSKSACGGCSNNPKNGGNGICNCTLGQQTFY